VTTNELDADPYKINVLNGTLAVKRCQTDDGDMITLKSHDRADRITKLAPIEYRPKAECPQYDAFLAEVQPDPKIRCFLHQWGGLGLTGDASIQKFCVWYGRGRNGKGTTLDVWGHIAGDYCGSVSIETFLEQSRSRRGGDATPGLAKLPGVRMLRTSEPDRGAKLAEALIKLVTGGDPIDARHLNREFFSAWFLRLEICETERDGIFETDGADRVDRLVSERPYRRSSGNIHSQMYCAINPASSCSSMWQ
jgi:putative DNA primase/helicase